MDRKRTPPVEKRVRPAGDLAHEHTPVQVWRRILARRLRARVGSEVEVTVTDNIHTMLTYVRERGRYRVRLHHMFLLAPPEVLSALARYLTGNVDGSAVLDGFIEGHRHLIRRVPVGVRQRRVRLEPHGAAHDLARIFDEVNARHFAGAVRAEITWATVPRVRGIRSSIKLGSYSEETRIIRIHPALDDSRVPRYFIEWIVFHEMLHVVEGAVRRGGRRVVHTERFLARERAFPDLARARTWERRNLHRLLAWQPRPRRGH